MVRPKHNLPPESQQWARTIERELQQAQFDVGQSAQGNTNAFKALNSTMKQVSEQLATLTTQQATLTAQVTDLASRVTVTTSIATFNTGSLPNDATLHAYGADIPITINVPTGRIVVTIGCGEASLNCGSGQVLAEATFSISGGVVPAYGSFVSRAFLQAGATTWTSNSLSVQRAFVVTPGTYTITGKMRAWASGSATASVNFVQPYLTVQVTG